MPALTGAAAALLPSLLRRALPDLGVLDLGAPTTGGLYPWWPSARVGGAAREPLAPAERALLARFRRGPGARPLAGADPAADAALAAGAAAAWAGAAHRLMVPAAGDATPGHVLRWTAEAGAMVLVHANAGAAVARDRVALVLGAGTEVSHLELALPDGRLTDVLHALDAGACALAREASAGPAVGGAWTHGARRVAPRLGGLTLLAPSATGWTTTLDADDLLLDPDGPRLRVLLGVLPARRTRLRMVLEPHAAAAALFVDGVRWPAAFGAAPDAVVLDATLVPCPTAATVLGLVARPGGPAPVVRRVELAAA